MAKWIYIGGILILAVLVGVVFYSWLGGEQTITTAATSVPDTGTTQEKAAADDCPATEGTFFYSQALADKIVRSCSKCMVTNLVRRADYIAVTCST